jgi:hypothetical protein
MIQFLLRHWARFGALGDPARCGHCDLAGCTLLVFWVLQRFARRRGAVLDQSLIQHGQRPSRWIFPLRAALAVLPGLPLPRPPS